MNKGGRPRKPASLNNSNSYSKAEKEEMAQIEDNLRGSDSELQDIPDYLDDLAKEYYKFIITELEISGLLGNLDKPLVEQTADTLSKMRQCDEILNRDGILIEEVAREGVKLKEHPTVKTKNTYLNQFQKLSTQLGMSPSSRASLAAMVVEKEEDEANPLLTLLKSRQAGG